MAHPASDPAPTPDEGPPRQPASVYLIGAGPGDPGLLTLRGAELLARSDVVLYDGLSNRALLQHAPQAEKISVGKHGQSRIWTQQEIIEEMLRHVRAGKTVARLKGGDPAVFARTADEIEVNLGSLDEPDQLMPTYESWIIRRESWLPPFPIARRYARDRDTADRFEE